MGDQTREAFSLSNSDVGKVRGLGSKNRESKGMGYLELLADHTIGLDNEYESFGEKLGKEFNKDEIGFLKNMGTGVVKGAIEFASEPIKSTKEMYLELKSSANNLFKKSLTDRVGEMYNLSMEEASDEQVTAAREKIIGDAFIASGLIPSTKFIAEVAATGINTAAKQLQTADLSKLNKVMSKANEVAEEVEGRLNQSVLGSGYRAVAKESIGKGKGADLPAATAAASNMGMVEKVFHITNDFDPNEEIFPGTMQWNPDEGVFNIPPDRKGEITTLKTPDEVALERASFQGITLKELIEKEGLDYLNNPKMAHDFLGVHVGTSKAAAARYSDNVKVDNILGEQKTVGATTQQLKVRTNKPFKDNGKPWTEKGLNTFLRKEMSKIKDGMVYEKMQVIRRQLAEAGFTHVPYINNVEDVLNISYVMLVDRPQGKGVNSSAVIRDRNAKFNPLDKAKRDQRLAQGGLIDMNNQTQMAFALGGEAETRDPVSGNDVPPGSLPVEVRDDIPARLSEGEYVVPADVVRFFGVKFFEDIRMQAKKGLQQMDRDGRIGGEPVDDQMISDQDLAQLEGMLSQQGMAAGGLAQGGMMDKLLNAVRTNPVVNERMKAAGIPIEMAVGGSVGIGIPSNSQNVDPRKVDEVIAKIGAAAQQNPELMRMLGERGINVPRTTATQTPEQMQQANSPAATTNPIMNEKPVAANAGGLMGYQEGGTAGYMAANPTGTFDPTKYTTVGGTLFDPNTYTPGSSVPIPEAAPAATEPAGGCGLGMMWNGQMCVIDPDYRAVKFNDDDNEPPIETDKVEQKPWYEQDPNFFADPKKFIADQIGRGEFGDEAQLGMALSPVAGVVAAFANKLEDGNGVAKARAAFAIHQALGTEGFEEGGEYSKAMTATLAAAGYNAIGTGKMYKDRFAKDYGFDNFEEASSKSTEFSSKYKPKDGKESTAIGGGIYGLTNRELFARKHKNRVKYAKLRKEGKIFNPKTQNPDGSLKEIDVAMGQGDNDSDDYNKAAQASRDRAAASKAITKKVFKDNDIDTSTAEGVSDFKDKVEKAGGDWNKSGRNKGGLITKRKKK